jgi:hypothetical protein
MKKIETLTEFFKELNSDDNIDPNFVKFVMNKHQAEFESLHYPDGFKNDAYSTRIAIEYLNKYIRFLENNLDKPPKNG